MTIGKLAEQAGVGVETVRFYERKGLVKKPAKRESGFRTYGPEEVTRIRFIKRAQELGFTLREVKDLVDLQSKKKMTGGQMQKKADEKITEIRQKILDLKKMETSLRQLSQVCGEGEQAIKECRFLECFEKGC
jgi:MerR family mercuric resistance operon transcriptional regulator